MFELHVCRYIYTQKLTAKSDVYSFGIVLLELTTAQPAIISQGWNIIPIAKFVELLLERGEIDKIVHPKLNKD